MQWILVVLASLMLGGCSLNQSGQELGMMDVKPTITQQETGNGTISGQLSFPSEKMPDDLTVCAQNTSSQKEYCSSKKEIDEKDKFKIGYSLEVPAGEYIVYGKTISIADYKAYYSEYIKCGMKVDCTEHNPITVVVQANQTTNNVDPNDWYNL